MAEAVTFDALGQVQSMRLTTRAGRKLERSVGMSFNSLMTAMEKELGFNTLTAFFAACLNDGNGVPEARAEEIIDDIGGLTEAVELVGAVVTASMPEPDNSGNVKAGKKG